MGDHDAETPKTSGNYKEQTTKHKFSRALSKVLTEAKGPQDIARWFDKIYSIFNDSIKDNNSEDALFTDFSKLINELDNDHHKTDIFNGSPKTPFGDFYNKTIGQQFSQLTGLRAREENITPEGGNCNYWTLLLYKIFNSLKDAGLDLKIKIFRYKQSIDKIDEKSDENNVTDSHSGLLVTFKGKNYIVDRANDITQKNETIIRSVQSVINILNKTLHNINSSNSGSDEDKLKSVIKEINKLNSFTIELNENKLESIINNFKKELDINTPNKEQIIIDVLKNLIIGKKISLYEDSFNGKNSGQTTNLVKFFDEPGDFISYLDRHPVKKTMAFYSHLGISDKNRDFGPKRISLEFIEGGIHVEIGDKAYDFFLNKKMSIKARENGYQLFLNNKELKDPKLPENIENEFSICRIGNSSHPISNNEKKFLRKLFKFVISRAKIDYLDFFPDINKHIAKAQEFSRIIRDVFTVNYPTNYK